MITKFQNKAITANMVVLPSKEVDFMEEASNYAFSENQMKKLKKVMGFGTRRISIPGETVLLLLQLHLRTSLFLLLVILFKALLTLTLILYVLIFLRDAVVLL